ncbi:MAG: SRPBCC family protein [Planctomycetota bacterium]
MRVYTLEREQTLGAPRDVVFEFFSDAKNLEKITPPALKFRTVDVPDEIERGTLIRYRLSLYGVPFGWTTEITGWSPPHSFVDAMKKGPYQLWEHTHSFEDLGDRTHMIDHVRYAVFGGAIVVPLFVRRELERIFDYRTARMIEFFGSG